MDFNLSTATPALDPDVVADIVDRSGLVSRRDAIRRTALYGAAFAASPLALAAFSRKAYARGGDLPANVVDALSFALTLEHLEYEFYAAGVAAVTGAGSTPNLIPGRVDGGDRQLFTTVRNHERDHVLFLQTVLGDAIPGDAGVGAPATPEDVVAGRPLFGFDFTAGGTLPDVFTNYQTFLAVAQGLEDTGVRAYKGQAPGLISDDAALDGILQAALQIHSVEARHASAVRRIRGLKGWITGSVNEVPAIQATYNGEEATVEVAGYTAEQISEAFDEPLTKDAVLAIAGPFIRTSAAPAP